MSAFEEIGKFPTMAEAEVVVSFLRANDIDAAIKNAHTNTAFGGVLHGNCRVTVPADQAEKARQLINDIEHQ